MSLLATCPICHTTFYAEPSGDSLVICPKGHVFPLDSVSEDDERLLDCEIRDWERFSVLPTAVQQNIIEAIQNGKLTKSLIPLMVKLRDAGIIVCT